MNDLLKGIGICFGFIGFGICCFLVAISMRGCQSDNKAPAIGVGGYVIDISYKS